MGADMKIPSGGAGHQIADAVSEAGDAPALTRPEEAADGAGAADAVSRVAEDVAAGRISRDEAIERLLGETMSGDLVASAPEAVRADLERALRSLLETDPHLSSLVSSMAESGE